MCKVTNVQAIKAELYNLQWHNCNGRLTMRPDGRRDLYSSALIAPDDRPCSGYSRILKLQHQLRKTIAPRISRSIVAERKDSG